MYAQGMALLPEMLKRPKPGDLRLSVPPIRLSYSTDILELVENTTQRVAYPDEDLERRAQATLCHIRASSDLGSDPRYQLDDLSRGDISVVTGALMLGLALGIEEEVRGWRVGRAIARSGGPLRRWWQDKRPRNSDPRTLEALRDLQSGAMGLDEEIEHLDLLCMYLILLGYWYSFDEWPIDA